MEPDRWSVERLTADLCRLGVVAGDVVMVHASLRAVGPVPAGADGVIDALEAAVGPRGTLLLNLGARDDWAWVSQRPERDRPDLLRDAEPFDCLLTPADRRGGHGRGVPDTTKDQGQRPSRWSVRRLRTARRTAA